MNDSLTKISFGFVKIIGQCESLSFVSLLTLHLLIRHRSFRHSNLTLRKFFQRGGYMKKYFYADTPSFRSFRHHFLGIGSVKIRFVKNSYFVISLSFVSSFSHSHFTRFVMISVTICALYCVPGLYRYMI